MTELPSRTPNEISKKVELNTGASKIAEQDGKFGIYMNKFFETNAGKFLNLLKLSKSNNQNELLEENRKSQNEACNALGLPFDERKSFLKKLRRLGLLGLKCVAENKDWVVNEVNEGKAGRLIREYVIKPGIYEFVVSNEGKDVKEISSSIEGFGEDRTRKHLSKLEDMEFIKSECVSFRGKNNNLYHKRLYYKDK